MMDTRVRTYAQQKAALTRITNKAKAHGRDVPTDIVEAVKNEIRRAMREWDSREGQFTYGWPDDWARWQRALHDLPGELWTDMRSL